MPAKIATAEDIQNEIRTLWAMTEEEVPSREKLAAALNDLASRVAGNRSELSKCLDDIADTASSASRSAKNPKHGKKLVESAIYTMKDSIRQLEGLVSSTDWETA
jgi:methyl-accepting chemotaxis protein